MVKPLLILITVLVVVGSSYYLWKNRNPTPQISTITSSDSIGDTTLTQESLSDEDESIQGSLSSLLNLDQDYSCTFQGTDEAGNQQNGVVYIADSGNKFNGEFNIIQSDSEPLQSFVVRDGEYNYVWSDYFEQGYKTSITPDQTTFFDTGSASDQSIGFSEHDNFDFNCSPWTVDNSIFVPPSSIDFIDVTQQIEQLQEGNSDTLQSQCGACDLLPEGDIRNQCLSGLGCN